MRIFPLFNFQGLLVATIFCFFNGEVRWSSALSCHPHTHTHTYSPEQVFLGINACLAATGGQLSIIQMIDLHIKQCFAWTHKRLEELLCVTDLQSHLWLLLFIKAKVKVLLWKCSDTIVYIIWPDHVWLSHTARLFFPSFTHNSQSGRVY